MSLFRRARITLSEKGILYIISNIIPYIYNNKIAPLLPRRSAVLNGVDTKSARMFDSMVPWRNMSPHRPYFESGLISAIENHAQENDEIIIVGGGWGVTAVKAAEIAGEKGNVIVYEGSKKKVEDVRETLKLNGVENKVDVRHAIVGPHISLMGGGEEGENIQPSELPECDVLELDCEGSEIEILNNLHHHPRAIFVESHGMNGASSDEIKNILRDMSYSIEMEEVADKGIQDLCRRKDITSIAALRD